MLHNADEAAPFEGFPLPTANYFRLPNDWTDVTARLRSWAEHRVVEYLLRHTWGYQEYGLYKRITTDEFMSGRKRRDGSRMDLGTGLSKTSVLKGLAEAVEDGYIQQVVDGTDAARIRKSYRLRMSPAVPPADPTEPP